MQFVRKKKDFLLAIKILGVSCVAVLTTVLFAILLNSAISQLYTPNVEKKANIKYLPQKVILIPSTLPTPLPTEIPTSYKKGRPNCPVSGNAKVVSPGIFPEVSWYAKDETLTIDIKNGISSGSLTFDTGHKYYVQTSFPERGFFNAYIKELTQQGWSPQYSWEGTWGPDREVLCNGTRWIDVFCSLPDEANKYLCTIGYNDPSDQGIWRYIE